MALPSALWFIGFHLLILVGIILWMLFNLRRAKRGERQRRILETPPSGGYEYYCTTCEEVYERQNAFGHECSGRRNITRLTDR